MDSRGSRSQRVHAGGYSRLRRSREPDEELCALDTRKHKGTSIVCERQQWFRLAVHQLVLLALHRWEPVWPFEHEPRLAVQGNCQRHVPEFQAPAEDRPYTSSDRRRTRKCRGSLGDEGNGSEDCVLSTIRSPCEA